MFLIMLVIISVIYIGMVVMMKGISSVFSKLQEFDKRHGNIILTMLKCAILIMIILILVSLVIVLVAEKMGMI